MFLQEQRYYCTGKKHVLNGSWDVLRRTNMDLQKEQAMPQNANMAIFHEDFEYGHLEPHNPVQSSPTSFSGKILATGFSNYAMPFIRYDVGDSATWTTEKCSCGRHSEVIASIDGRNEDVIVTPEGARMQMHSYFYKDMNEIQECQVVQYKLGEMVFRIVPRDNYTSEVELNLIRKSKKIYQPRHFGKI